MPAVPALMSPSLSMAMSVLLERPLASPKVRAKMP
jgi:hypothetical protein